MEKIQTIGPSKPGFAVMIKDPTGLYQHELDVLSRDIQIAGGAIESRPYPEAQAEFAGPLTTIIFTVDPETLRQVTKAALEVIAAWKSADLIRDFWKAAIDAAATESVKAAFEAVRAFLRRIYTDLNDISAQGEHSRFLLGLESPKGYAGPIDISAFFFPTYLPYCSEADFENAYAMLMFRLLPLLHEMSDFSARLGASLTSVKADWNVGDEKPGSWFWSIEIAPIGDFVLDAQGLLRPRYEQDYGQYFGRHFRVRSRVRRQGIYRECVPIIVSRSVRRLREAQNRKPPSKT